MYWGLSESLDLYEEYLRAFKGLPEPEEEGNTKGQPTDKTEETSGLNNEKQECLEEQNEKNEEDCTERNSNVAEDVEEKSEIKEDAIPKKPFKNIEIIEENCEDIKPPPRKLNILLFGAGDPRHVIHTLAKLYKHNQNEKTPIELNFFMLDGCMEIVARNIALLSIALEEPSCLSLQTKVHLFMDIYGNSMVRPSTHQYLVGKAKSLLSICTDEDVREKIAPIISIEGLKYRERDNLESAFNFWLPKEGHVFNIQQYWETRNRHLLTTRYDHREGAFDWDLNMTLKDRGAKQICSQEYRHWRECGIAFTFPEYEQCKPNKTLAASLVRNGDKFLHRGYVGDVQTGPFCCFGLKCKDTRMLNSQHGDNDYRATDITERNLLEHFHELQERTPYEHDLKLSRRYGSVKLLMGKTLQWNECDVDVMVSMNKPWLKMGNVHVNFLSQEDVFGLQHPTDRWKNFFDVAFVGHNYFAFLRESFVDVLRENALLILETKLYTIDRRDDVKAFENKLKDYARNSKLSPVINYNAIHAKYPLLKFKKVIE